MCQHKKKYQKYFSTIQQLQKLWQLSTDEQFVVTELSV